MTLPVDKQFFTEPIIGLAQRYVLEKFSHHPWHALCSLPFKMMTIIQLLFNQIPWICVTLITERATFDTSNSGIQSKWIWNSLCLYFPNQMQIKALGEILQLWHLFTWFSWEWPGSAAHFIEESKSTQEIQQDLVNKTSHIVEIDCLCPDADI